jgi:hypothetical protein
VQKNFDKVNLYVTLKLHISSNGRSNITSINVIFERPELRVDKNFTRVCN